MAGGRRSVNVLRDGSLVGLVVGNIGYGRVAILWLGVVFMMGLMSVSGSGSVMVLSFSGKKNGDCLWTGGRGTGLRMVGML